MRLLKESENYIGLGVNYNKTKILRVGSLRETNAQFYSTLSLKWSDGPVQVFGILIANNITGTTKLNYEIAFQKAKVVATRMHSGRMLQWPSLLPCTLPLPCLPSRHTYPLPCTPPAMHALSAIHAPTCHTYPLPCTHTLATPTLHVHSV